MKTIKQSYLIKASQDKVWQALVDPKVIEGWGGGPALMNETEGTKFSLWGGDIYGTNLKVVKNQELVQDWYGGKWGKPSKLTFKLTSEDDQTRVTLLQENVPDDQADDITDGWKKYYLGPLKKLLERS